MVYNDTNNYKKELQFLNNKIDKKNIEYPKYLYKYRPFDEYTFDMLENEYLYLCPAKNLDDIKECDATLNIKDYYDWTKDRLKSKCIDMIMEMLFPCTSEQNLKDAKQLLSKVVTPEGLISPNWLLDISSEMQQLVPDEDISPVVNYLRYIPEKLDEPQISDNVENLFSVAMKAKEKMGICSLSQINNSTDMWQNYTNNSTGYCVEYDMENYKELDSIFPVVYNDNRNTDVFENIMRLFIATMVSTFSTCAINMDKSSYARIFLTKDTIWSYQKEWRLIGEANQKIKAPKVNAIYLGKNIEEKNKQNMLEFCKKQNIVVKYV